MDYLKANIEKGTHFLQAGIFSADASFEHIRRIIRFHVILIVLKGTIYIENNGVKYDVSAGDILFLPANCVHKGYKQSEEPVSYMWIHFTLEDDIEIIDESMFKNTFDNVLLHTASDNEYVYLPFYSSSLKTDKIIILLNQIIDSYKRNYYTILYQNHLTTVFLMEITQQSLYNLSDTNKNIKSVDKILEWIRANCYRKISLDDISDKFGYTKSYICRIFKSATNMTVTDYINYNKIEYAKQLLMKTSISAKEVAYTIGIKDYEYFNRLFKKYEKITPTQFRNSCSKTHYNSEIPGLQ